MTNAHKNLPLTGNRCLCGACGEYFNSVGAFDAHRKGKGADRYCGAPEELGMSLSAAGYWIITPYKEKAA